MMDGGCNLYRNDMLALRDPIMGEIWFFVGFIQGLYSLFMSASKLVQW